LPSDEDENVVNWFKKFELKTVEKVDKSDIEYRTG
jgi:hypothetical protein